MLAARVAVISFVGVVVGRDLWPRNSRSLHPIGLYATEVRVNA